MKTLPFLYASLAGGAGGSEFEHRFLRVATDGALRSDVELRCR